MPRSTSLRRRVLDSQPGDPLNLAVESHRRPRSLQAPKESIQRRSRIAPPPVLAVVPTTSMLRRRFASVEWAGWLTKGKDRAAPTGTSSPRSSTKRPLVDTTKPHSVGNTRPTASVPNWNDATARSSAQRRSSNATGPRSKDDVAQREDEEVWGAENRLNKRTAGCRSGRTGRS